MWGGGGGGCGGAYSITYHCCPYIHPFRPVHNTNVFHSISFENISILDSNFIHRYILIKCRSSPIRSNSTNYYGSYGPFSTLKNGFHSISFENINVLDSYFIHGYLTIKYRSSLI